MNPTRSTANGFNIIGISGGGKTTAVKSVLDLYPQVIFHSVYKARPFTFCQVVWLTMTCPFDASVKALCGDFFRILDDLLGTHHYDTYAKGKTTDDMLPGMARVAAIHGLGALFMDEIQFLSEGKSGGREQMLNFFCDLTNRIGLPVVFIGTYKALRMLSGEFRQIRRGCGEGEKRWERLTDAKTWRFFLKALWGYQYTQHPTPLSDELSDLFFDLTQGIPDLCVKLYYQSQIRAIRTGLEAITPVIVRSVAQDSFVAAQPVLDALRRKDAAALELISDVDPVDLAKCLPTMDKIGQTTSLLPPRDRGETKARAAVAGTASPPTTPAKQRSRQPPDDASKKAEHPADGPMAPTAQAPNDHKLSSYDRLKAQGFIRPGTEFLGTEGGT